MCCRVSSPPMAGRRTLSNSFGFDKPKALAFATGLVAFHAADGNKASTFWAHRNWMNSMIFAFPTSTTWIAGYKEAKT